MPFTNVQMVKDSLAIAVNPVMCTPINPPLDVVSVRPISSLRDIQTALEGKRVKTARPWPALLRFDAATVLLASAESNL